MEINLIHNGNGNVTTVIVTEASTIAAVMAAMRSTERRIAAKEEDIRFHKKSKKLPKWKYNLQVLRAAHAALEDRLVELAKAEALAAGGKIWVNRWRGDVAPSDVAIPQDWRNIRGGTSVRTWPRAQAGDIVTHEGTTWQVVVNVVWQRVSGQYADVFSVYAIIPA